MTPETQYARDFTTPQGAILRLEDAYRAGDIDAVIRAKDFRKEAELLLARFRADFAADSSLIGETAATLEAVYRASIRDEGFPDIQGTVSSFSAPEPYAEGVVVVTEMVRWPDGGTSQQRLLVAQTPDGWRVLNPLSEGGLPN